MKQSEWKDRDIKELIKKLPAIKDDRHPNFIYSRISQKNNKSLIVFKRFIPTLVAITALCIVVLLSPTLVTHFQWGQHNEKSMDKALSGQSNESTQSLTGELRDESKLTGETKTEISKDQSFVQNVSFNRSALYRGDLENGDYVSFGLVSADAIPVPVSVPINLKKTQESWLEQFNKISKELPEERWGFEDYYPLKGEFRAGDKKNEIKFILADDHPYSGSSAAEYNFYYSLNYSLKGKGIDYIILENLDGTIPQFSTIGSFPKIDLTKTIHQAYYIYSPNGKDRYFVPDNRDRGDISSAIEIMKNSDSRFYESVIPKELNISVKESGEDVTLNFLNELDLESMNPQSAMELIEGLLLTAKSSGYEKVLFHNIKQENWGGFDFNHPIETPLGANKKTLENK